MANTFKGLRSRGIGTSAVQIGTYTVPVGATATVIGLTLANTTNAPVTADVMIYDGTNSTYIIKTCVIPVGSTAVLAGGDQKIVLAAGESIRVVSSAAASIDAAMNVLEAS